MHSLTYLEAMACGLPLICRDDPCLKGVLADGDNGYIYSTKEEFVRKTLDMLGDDEKRRRMSERSLELSEKFSEEAFADKMLQLYKEVCNIDK